MIVYIMALLLALLIFLCFSDAIFSVSPSRSRSDSAAPRRRAETAPNKDRQRVVVLPLGNRHAPWEAGEVPGERRAHLGEGLSHEEARAAD